MPRPVCGDPVPVKLTHRGKPYWQCDPCGVQVFVRRKERDILTQLGGESGALADVSKMAHGGLPAARGFHDPHVYA